MEAGRAMAEPGRPVRRGRRLLFAALVALLAAETAWLAYPTVRRRALGLEVSAAARGERLASELGCFACHGAGGQGGVKNPGSEEGEVPAFTERTQMMYVKSADDLREYVLDGAPRRKREDPDYRRKMEAAALRMPAYRPFVSDAQVDDLVAFLRAASDQIVPEDGLAARGAELAATLHCAACHGPLGAGGVPNPGSFKGYVPGFQGADFDELVHDDDELRQWIAEGRIPRIADHPVGGVFFRRQAIKMAAYGEHVSAADVAALAAWVRWCRDRVAARDGGRATAARRSRSSRGS
jgi:mono/diheme cytochrome c family protein